MTWPRVPGAMADPMRAGLAPTLAAWLALSCIVLGLGLCVIRSLDRSAALVASAGTIALQWAEAVGAMPGLDAEARERLDGLVNQVAGDAFHRRQAQAATAAARDATALGIVAALLLGGAAAWLVARRISRRPARNGGAINSDVSGPKVNEAALAGASRRSAAALDTTAQGLALASRTRRTLEAELRRALAEDALELHYQPLVDTVRGTVSGFEALLRWSHPTRGPISPAEFIPVAEHSGLIVPLGEWVLRRATRDAMAWPGDRRVAVNVSPLQFRSANLTEAVLAALRSSGLPPQRLEIEITENTLIEDGDAVLAVLRRLRETGVRVALDDFGTGYSSLAALQAFPFDRIKIDQSFVQVPPDGVAQAEAIVRAVAGLAVALGMRCTGEGVETMEQLARLRSAGCTEIQGYYLSRPLPTSEVPWLIERIEAMELVVG